MVRIRVVGRSEFHGVNTSHFLVEIVGKKILSFIDIACLKIPLVHPDFTDGRY